MASDVSASQKVLLSAAETAAALSVSLPTLRRWSQELLRPVRIGRNTRWPADEVRAFVERLKSERNAGAPAA